ncbi:MAG TPA: YlcI/YnfO family protein [Ideonella sp.]|uniref:YlcI/YnfO family protein n=1 Tax=Ideonella sp. TaxID=1929293 RepID=UPI002C946456|nr:YlcI/YnfO family protein [Ideonella sp.]HSI47661.1 YlcI/YnfO family protein [Ideonella sp.]
MKTSILPQVRVEPKLRADLESVLREGETLSEFVEASVRKAVDFRRVQDDFYARGEASWQDYQRTGEAHPVDDVLAELRAMTEARRKQLGL